MRRFVVVRGLPAGKTTLGRAIAGYTGLPLIDKDEHLFDAEGVGDPAW
jgi:shikimate kinase